MRSVSNGRRRTGRPALRRAAENAATQVIAVSGIAAIIILVAITAFLVINAGRAISDVGIMHMITGTDWFPTSENASYGFLPAITGSAWVTLVALIVCVPVGIAAAVFISEFAGRRTADILKSVVEFMAAVPSVVLGLLGLTLLVPNLRVWLHLETGLTALVAGIVVGIMALPTIVSISEDALHAVPNDLRQGSLALGNTRWQTVHKVVLPAASSGIFAAVMLGVGRAIGETMVVLMLAGNSGIIAGSPLESVRTMPGTIAGEMAEVVQGGEHYSVLFAMALVLFVVTFIINLVADVVLERQRRKWRR